MNRFGETFVGCQFTKNTTTEKEGLVVVEAQNVPLKVIGCTFNNAGKIQIISNDSRITVSMAVFSGCEMRDIALPIICTRGRGILFDSCLFNDDVTASGNIEETTAGAVKLKNCYLSTYGTLLER